LVGDTSTAGKDGLTAVAKVGKYTLIHLQKKTCMHGAYGWEFSQMIGPHSYSKLSS